MVCPKCGIEVRVKGRMEDGSVILVCRNPKCEDHLRVVATLK